MGGIILIAFVIAIVVVAFALLVGILIQRLISIVKRRRLEAGIKRIQSPLEEYLGNNGDKQPVLQAMRKERAAALATIIAKFKEAYQDERAKLMEIARDSGLVDQAIAQSKHINWKHREIAAMQLGVFGGTAAIPELVRMLKDGTEEVQYTAARSLASLGSEDAFTALLDILNDPENLDVSRLLEIVQQVPRPDIEPFSRTLLNESAPLNSRLWVIDLAGEWKEKRLLPALRQTLNSDNNELVIRSIKALARIGDEESLHEMLKLANHPRWEIRAQVVRAVSALGYQEALPVVQGMLTDEAYWVRRAAAETLAELGDQALVLLQHEHENSPDRFAKDISRYQLERLGLISESGSALKSAVMPSLQAGGTGTTPNATVEGN